MRALVSRGIAMIRPGRGEQPLKSRNCGLGAVPYNRCDMNVAKPVEPGEQLPGSSSSYTFWLEEAALPCTPEPDCPCRCVCLNGH